MNVRVMVIKQFVPQTGGSGPRHPLYIPIV
jgi:hypothetical protein